MFCWSLSSVVELGAGLVKDSGILLHLSFHGFMCLLYYLVNVIVLFLREKNHIFRLETIRASVMYKKIELFLHLFNSRFP